MKPKSLYASNLWDIKACLESQLFYHTLDNIFLFQPLEFINHLTVFHRKHGRYFIYLQ